MGDAQDNPGTNLWSPQCEAAVLGVCLDGRNDLCVIRAAEQLPDPRAFYGDVNRRLWLVILALARAGEHVDALTVTAALAALPQDVMLARLKDLEDGGRRAAFARKPDLPYEQSALMAIGASAVGDAAEAFAPVESFQSAVEVVQQHWLQRQALDVLRKAAGDLQEATGRPLGAKIAQAVCEALNRLVGPFTGGGTFTSHGRAALVAHDAAATAGDSPAGEWGLPALDELVRLSAPRLVVLAARPGCGKTSLMLQAAKATARTWGPGSAGIVSLEMGGQDLVRIIVAGELGIPRWTTERGRMTTDERARFEQAVQAWKEHDMPIREVCGSNTGLDICAWIRVQHAQAQGRLRLVCVDYLQLIAGGAARLSENDRLGEITRSLKLVALELGVCILLLSQMNRESAKESRLPRLSDLRGSGNIEQDADSVIFLHGPDAPGEPTVVVQAMVCKNRGGPTGDVQLTFHKRDGQRFTQVGAPSASHGSGKPPMERREDPGDVFSTTAITTNDEGATP